ncbi:MAG: 50S ribosomal protein L23 [Patescibacteria group bacterium]
MKFDPSTIIIRPRITEKAAALSETGNVYTFEVTQSATKTTIKRAIKEIYKVAPSRVNIVNLKAKNVIVKGKKGSTKAVVKAYVYLKKGDKIDLA